MPNNNITFGVNLLPSPTGTYALGSTTQKWKLYADEINGIAISMLSTSDHTHTLNLTQAESGTATINLTENTAYTLTAGGNSIVFKTPEDTTYTAGAGITLTNTVFSNSGVRSVNASTNNGYISVNTNGTSNDIEVYDLPVATDGILGGVQIGYATNGKNYPVELSSNKMYVNVPWTDTDTKVIQKIKSDSKNYKLLLASDSPSNGEAAEAYYSAYTTLNPQSGTLTIGTSSGTGTLTASQYSGNAATASLADKATAANITSTQYGIAYYNNTSGTFASTSQGTSAQALIGGGTNAAPQFVSINTTLTNTAATANASQKLQVTVLGQSSSVVEFDKAATDLYGVTLLSNSFTSGTTRNTSTTTAAHPNAIWNAIDSLDASAVGVAANVGNRFISQINENNGIINATLSTANIGANNQPIFITDGVLTAASSGIGTSTGPIYMNTNGKLTPCGALIQLNGTDLEGTKASFYAPTNQGIDKYIIYSNSGSPEWILPQIQIGTQTKTITNDNVFNSYTLLLDLGITNIFHYQGIRTDKPTETSGVTDGDVYIVSNPANSSDDGIYAYKQGNGWQKISLGAGYKIMQDAYGGPTNTTSNPHLVKNNFIATISQDVNGVISATNAILPGTNTCGAAVLQSNDWTSGVDNNNGYWIQSITKTPFYTLAGASIEARIWILSNYTALKDKLIVDTSYNDGTVTMTFKIDKTNQPDAPTSDINIEYSLHAIYEG